MSEFYDLAIIDYFDKHFAYNEHLNDQQFIDASPDPQTCPVCGRLMGRRYWPEPRKIILSKPKYGDFVSGNAYLVSENFKTAYEQSDLKGIKKFIPVEVEKVRYARKHPAKPPQYYSLEVVYSLAQLDRVKSKIEYDVDLTASNKACSLCSPYGIAAKSVINGLHIDTTNWAGEDIFHIHEMGSSVYASQKFVDFCLEHNFTNFKYMNTKDYMYPPARFR